LVENRVLPDITDFKGNRLDSRITVEAMPDQEGKLARARASGNHDTLAARTVDAARQSKFRPYLLHDTPLPVPTQIGFVLKLRAVVSR
jgi:hypothetical protein